jgi:deoxyribodipyrimidine photo-lyase
LADNPALDHALLHGAVIPVFILDDRLLSKPAPKRKNFLFEGLKNLDKDLRSRGSRLVVRSGEPLQELNKLIAETGADLISAEEDYSPYGRKRDDSISRQLPLKLSGGLTLYHPSEVLKKDRTPYTIFTPYKNAWSALPKINYPNSTSPRQFHVSPQVQSLELPEFQKDFNFPASETVANDRLSQFILGSIFEYAKHRDVLASMGTSHLSPYLRFGMLSARRVISAAEDAINSAPDSQARHGAQVWLTELMWREFYESILFHFPFVLKMAFKPGLRQIDWANPENSLTDWQEGRTGYPVVDAGMRQLSQTGWMHNRARMITASFLSKDLLLNWQLGEEWFMKQLIDGDPASNNGGWQWAAGTGTDAAPYFRIFNPVTQSKRFDPLGDYIRRWVPELFHVPLEFIHTPWMMPHTEQSKSGCLLGKDYPPPIVEHDRARDRALKAYKDSRYIS